MVIGTRPEAIKLSPVAHALQASGIVPSIVLTGQHPIDPRDFGLEPFATDRLGCAADPDPFAFADAVAISAAPAIAGCSLVLVQGDTSSALGGALAASAAAIPLGHVEAGLRSHDRQRPWPEEEFRKRIDARSSLLFAPTALSGANLRRERLAGTIHITGNSGIDAAMARPLPPRNLRDGGQPRLLVTCHRRESWGTGLSEIAAALREIAEARPVDIRFVLHPNPSVAAEMRRLLSGHYGIELRPPCSHEEMLGEMRSADLVLSDSGGMQEEAPLLGVPLLVLRDRTERPEAIASGNIEIVGTSGRRIAATVTRLLGNPRRLADMSKSASPYGDGRAAERIAGIVGGWLQQT